MNMEKTRRPITFRNESGLHPIQHTELQKSKLDYTRAFTSILALVIEHEIYFLKKFQNFVELLYKMRMRIEKKEEKATKNTSLNA